MNIGTSHYGADFDIVTALLTCFAIVIVGVVIIWVVAWRSGDLDRPTVTKIRLPPIDNPLFEEWVREAIDSLPESFEPFLENVAIRIDDEPPDGYEEITGQGKIALGSCVHLILSTGGFVPMDSVITIFKKPILLVCAGQDEEQIKERIRKVLYHEIAHHLGFDEGQVRRLGV